MPDVHMRTANCIQHPAASRQATLHLLVTETCFERIGGSPRHGVTFGSSSVAWWLDNVAMGTLKSDRSQARSLIENIHIPIC